ncbi:PAS domain protein [Emiliania huxleyi CCMP1516]|uniref:PAS domain-containing protein n=2 Tax=Emiliania huxleyi TaxID=2903 RepID=A0A0D3IXR5_EMIH1|nr:PAS domain protein [Emiliania huxleyi CCMP1516]EOD16050.1 PAS domain protein [Emiliania huxleyi CCMP1516]|eukprot:XP_005768479.1 PAS domain protein [Emiliania huxleyi CCMP1516]
MEAMKLPYDCRGMPAYETEVDGWTVGPVLSKLHMSDEGLYDRMLSTARGSPTAAIVVDGEGRIIALNEAWTALCGYSPNEALHQSPKILQGDATDAAKARRFSDEVRECGAARTILANYSKGGDPFAHQLRSTKVCSRQGDSTYYFTESEAVADKAIERAVLDGEVYRLSGESDAFAALGVITLTACLLGLARLASLADGASIEIFATLGATIVLGAGGALLLGAHEAASIALRQAGRVYVVDGYD